MKILSLLRPSVLLLLPLTLALTAATPVPATDPISEVSCGPMTVKEAQQMFIDRGKTKIQVIALYGAAATAGAAHKHQLTLDPDRDYRFIQCVYLDDEPMSTNTGYNLNLKVTDLKKDKVLSQIQVRETGGGRPLGSVVVKRSTTVEIEYDYTANGPDQTGNCLTMLVISQPVR